MHPGPEKKPTFLFDRSGDRTRKASGPVQNRDRIGTGPRQDQNQDRGGIGIEAGPVWKQDRIRTGTGIDSG
jgi:hypothetical protein